MMATFFLPQDPEVTAAFMDVQSNPANAAKYENNPKVKKVMEKLSATLGAAGMGGGAGMGGMGGGGGGMGGMGGGGARAPNPPPSSSTEVPPEPAGDPMGSGMDLD